MALCSDHEAGCKFSHHVLGSIGHQQVGKDMIHEQSSGYIGSITLDILHDARIHQGSRFRLAEDLGGGGPWGLAVAPARPSLWAPSPPASRVGPGDLGGLGSGFFGVGGGGGHWGLQIALYSSSIWQPCMPLKPIIGGKGLGKSARGTRSGGWGGGARGWEYRLH